MSEGEAQARGRWNGLNFPHCRCGDMIRAGRFVRSEYVN